MAPPFFSVIIPTYNRSTIILKAIKSVFNQSFSDYELIVVDDGSTDDTQAILQPYIDDGSLKYIFQSNQGVCAARNYGVDLSAGRFIVFLDSDDTVKASWLMDFYDEYMRTKASILVCKLVNADRNYFFSGTFAIEKSIFIDVGMYDPVLRYGENSDLNWRLQERGYSLAYIDKQNFIYNKSLQKGIQRHRNIIDSFHHTFNKHKKLFQNSRKLTQQYYQSVAYSYFELQNRRVALKYFWTGFLTYPLNVKSFARAILYSIKALL